MAVPDIALNAQEGATCLSIRPPGAKTPWEYGTWSATRAWQLILDSETSEAW